MKIIYDASDGGGLGIVSIKVEHEFQTDSDEEALQIIKFLVEKLEYGYKEGKE